MLNYINAIIFGAVQGLTEFLPVSSSGHLVILHRFLSLPMENELTFDITLHFATFLAIVLFLRKEVWLLARSWFKSFLGQKDEYSRLSWLIIIATIPAALAGFFGESFIESRFRSPLLVAAMLALVGVVFIIAERITEKTDDMNKLSWKKSLVIGMSQAIALIPGTSRSGITIIAGLAAGLKREQAVRFSFLLAIPIIAGAALTKIHKIFSASLTTEEIRILIVAFVSAFISGLLAIKYFLQLAKKFSLNMFAYYRFLVAAILFIILFI